MGTPHLVELAAGMREDMQIPPTQQQQKKQ